ncbi:MAG: hypothetical protein RIF34_11735 [Candidatus Kapaibacterium sp.]
MRMSKDEILHKEIDLIQACINRMANNSFLLKGWAISLVAVVLALAKENVNFTLLSIILLIPILSFWYLDAFFLRTEKMYRKMYEWVISNRQNSDERMYELNPKKYESEVESTFAVIRSKTLRTFYGIPTLILIGIIVYNLFPNLFSC